MANKLSLDERVRLYEAMSQYGKDGKTIITLLIGKGARADVKKIQNGNIYRSIRSKLTDEGERLSAALKPYIPADEYIFIRVAEDRNNLSETLDALVSISQKKANLLRTLLTSSIGPGIFFLVSLIMSYVIIYILVPSFSEMLSDMEIAPFQRFMIFSVNTFLQLAYPAFVVALLLIFALTLYSLPNGNPSGLRLVLDKYIPIHRIYKDYVSSIVLIGLGASLNAGVHIKDYFSMYAGAAPRYPGRYVERMKVRINDGKYEPAQAVDIGFFLESDMETIYDYSSGGSSFAAAMAKIGSRAYEKAAGRIERTLKTVQWTFMILYILVAGGYVSIPVSAAIQAMSNNNYF